MKILVLNGGSSSFKCWFAELPDGDLPRDPLPPVWSVNLDWNQEGAAQTVLEPALRSLLEKHAKVDVAGHRVVHGGPDYRESTLLTQKVRAAIASQVEFAPVHNRFELEAIEAVENVLGADLPQVAVFDTGFHRTLEPAAYVYPGPYSWLTDGIRRYGFHGINHCYVARRAAEMLKRDPASLKIITCHLGNGASLAAVDGGKSIDTTMGFTPLEGLMMGSRCGSIDPAIIVYLIRHRGYSAEQLDHILNKESGLAGISGISADMREILAAIKSGHQRARLAFDIYVHRLTREIGGMLAVLGGLDALVFTGGIGENTPAIRQAACERLGFLGLRLDPSRNEHPNLDEDIAAADSTVRALVIRANEEWEIAREGHRITAGAGS